MFLIIQKIVFDVYLYIFTFNLHTIIQIIQYNTYIPILVMAIKQNQWVLTVIIYFFTQIAERDELRSTRDTLQKRLDKALSRNT